MAKVRVFLAISLEEGLAVMSLKLLIERYCRHVMWKRLMQYTAVYAGICFSQSCSRLLNSVQGTLAAILSSHIFLSVHEALIIMQLLNLS